MAKDRTFVFVLIVVAILFAHSAGYINLGGLLAAGGAEDKQEQEGTTLCLHDGATMTVGPAQQRYAPTTSVTSEYHRVYIDGIDRGLKSDGTSIDVATPTRIGGTDGSAIEIYYAENSTVHYANKQAFTVPCVNAFSSGARPDSDAYKLVANGTTATLTISAFNDDEGLKMQTDQSRNESISASDSANIDVKVNYPSKKGYSPFGKIYLTARYNATVIDGSDLVLTSNDVVVNDASTPQFRANAAAAAGLSMQTWSFPGYDSLATLVQHYNLYIESTTTDPTYPGANITLYFDDEDWYRNSESGLMEYGPETDTDTDVGDTSSISQVLVIT